MLISEQNHLEEADIGNEVPTNYTRNIQSYRFGS